MSIKVIKPGLLTTIQDSGRYKGQKEGIPVSGAMDLYSMKAANILTGNDENEGVLEITLTGPELKIKKDSLIAVTGADISPKVNNIAIPLNRPVYITKDSVLSFGRCIKGCRCYVAFAGGFDVSPVLGSKSTYMKGKMGGFEGRALKKGDVIRLGKKSIMSKKIIRRLLYGSGEAIDNIAVFLKRYIKNFIPENNKLQTIRVFEDQQFLKLTEDSREKLFSEEFIITADSDRMGYRIKGPELKLKEEIEMISGEVSFGTVQLPKSGNPIILLADRGVSGGYPKIIHIALADIHKLVQMKPGSRLKFKKISIEEAENLYIKTEKSLIHIKEIINEICREY